MGYLINDTGYNNDTIRIGIDDEAKRILDDGGSVEGYPSAADDINDVVTKEVYDKASVAMYPVAFKAGSLYCQKPTDGTKDFVFSRALDTATRFDSNGYITTSLENTPRLCFFNSLTTPQLLLEPTITNDVEDSEDFSTAYWDATSCDIVPNGVTTPDGQTNATKIVAQNGTTDFRLRTNTSAGGTINTHSVFIKHIEGGFDYVVLGSTNPQQRYAFNIATGSLVGDIGTNNALGASVEGYGNGWYRYSITVADSGGGNRFEIYLSDDGTDIVATGDGTKGAYIWGAQREQGSELLTSYIPTSGGTATRSAETATSTNLLNAGDDFTLMVDLEPITRNTTTEQYISGSGDFGFLDNNGRNVMRYSFNATDYTFDISELGSHKILFRKDSTDYKVYFNGSLAHTIATLPSGVQDLVLSSGKINKCLFFSSALTNTECEALTA
jgi:hypothetical protein